MFLSHCLSHCISPSAAGTPEVLTHKLTLELRPGGDAPLLTGIALRPSDVPVADVREAAMAASAAGRPNALSMAVKEVQARVSATHRRRAELQGPPLQSPPPTLPPLLDPLKLLLSLCFSPYSVCLLVSLPPSLSLFLSISIYPYISLSIHICLCRSLSLSRSPSLSPSSASLSLCLSPFCWVCPIFFRNDAGGFLGPCSQAAASRVSSASLGTCSPFVAGVAALFAAREVEVGGETVLRCQIAGGNAEVEMRLPASWPAPGVCAEVADIQASQASVYGALCFLDKGEATQRTYIFLSPSSHSL